MSQSRILGGSIGLSMATIVLNHKLSTGLAGTLDAARIKQLEQSLNTISSLSPANQALVAKLYADSFNEQMRVCTYLSIFALLAAIATYQRDPPSVAAMKEKQKAASDDSSDEGTELSSIGGGGSSQPESEVPEWSGHRERSPDVFQGR